MRTDGIQNDVKQREAVKNAEKLHKWPSEIGLGVDISAVNIFNKAQLQRDHDSWTPVDLIELARASKLIAMCDLEFEKLVVEGLIIMGGRTGMTKVENPRGRAIATLNTSINAILRRLGVSAMSSSEKKTIERQGQAERAARAAMAAAEQSGPEGGVSDADLLN